MNALVSCALVVGAVSLTAQTRRQFDEQAATTSSVHSTFAVGVDLVTVDAVVTDRRGSTVGDLAPSDFDLLQDGKRQRIIFAEFVPVVAPPQSNEDSNMSSARNGHVATTAALPPPNVPAPVSRTIIVVVDDLGLSVEGMNYIRRALHDFVNSGMLPTDRVAIVSTGDAAGMKQALTGERTALHAAIDALHYNMLSRKGATPTADVGQVGAGALEFGGVSPVQQFGSTAGSLGALNLAVRAARDLPGRRAVIFASEGFSMTTGDTGRARDEDPRVRFSIDRVIDQAVRAGVVINTLDCQGLQTGGLRASDDVHSVDTHLNPDAMGETVRRFAEERRRDIRRSQDVLEYLAEQGGGVAVLDTNDLAAGLTRIANSLHGYYLIGYEPEHNTFSHKGNAVQLHTIAVRVRRSGVVVRARKEFIGIEEPEERPGMSASARQLLRAAMSPYSATIIPLRITNVAGYSRTRSLFVRTILHIDASTLTFVAGGPATETASADVVGLVFDGAGDQISTIGTGFDITLKTRAIDRVRRSGLTYTTIIPIEKPAGIN